ncbi:MAG: hypothetical protein R3F59_07825 [Myxococcota bacterium]
MPMAQNRVRIAAVAAVGIGLGVGAVWLATPDPDLDVEGASLAQAEPIGPPRRTLLPPSADEAGRLGKAAHRSRRPRTGLQSKAKAGKAKAKAEREPRERRDPSLEPDDKAALRDEVRQERIASLSDRLGGYAAENGWDPEVEGRVEQIMLATTDKISRNLERVDRGEADWSEIRDDLRDYRIDQAKRIRNLLGDDEFDNFAAEMDLTRFMGDRPIRGRLE